MKLHAAEPAGAQRQQCPLVLEHAELGLTSARACWTISVLNPDPGRVSSGL